MTRARLVLVAVAALLASTLAPAGAQAQSRASRLIEAARVQMDNFEYDSAQTNLEQGLAAATSTAERQRGLVLYGIVALLRSNGVDRAGARQAFERALRLNPSYTLPDSLADLQNDARLAFAEARQIVPLPVAALPAGPAVAAAALTVAVVVPADTQVEAAEGRLRLEARPVRAARVAMSIAAADNPTVPIWGDTASVRGPLQVGWNMRTAAGALVTPGRYLLRVTATDSLNQASPIIERVLTVSRVRADTQVLPPPLAGLPPETVTVRRGSPAVLAIGLGIGAAAFMLPSALGNAQLNSGQSGDGTAMAVAGAASVAGVVGFLKGQRRMFSADNARQNAEARRRDEQARADITARNRAALAAAPVRIQVQP